MVLVLTPVSERSAGKASGEASTPAFWLSCTTKGHESTSTQMGFFFCLKLNKKMQCQDTANMLKPHAVTWTRLDLDQSKTL